MIPHLSDEDTDCINWGRWCRDDNPRLSYPQRWPIPEGERTETTEDAERPTYDVLRALATDAIFSSWLRAYRLRQDFVLKRHFQVIRRKYLFGHDPGDLTLLEALRCLRDFKDAANERLKKRSA